MPAGGVEVGRRAALIGAFVLAANALLAGDNIPRSRRAALDPNVAIRDRAVRASQHLARRYRATLQRHPRLGRRLEPLAAEHAAHLTALTGVATPKESARREQQPRVPSSADQALRALAAAEEQSAAERLVDLRSAAPPLARLLASVLAAQTVHAELLRG